MKKVLKLNKGWVRPRKTPPPNTANADKQEANSICPEWAPTIDATAGHRCFRVACSSYTYFDSIYVCVCVPFALFTFKVAVVFLFGFVLKSRLGGFHPQEGNILSVGNNFRFAMEHCKMVKRSIFMKSFLSLILSNSFILFLSRVRWFSG